MTKQKRVGNALLAGLICSVLVSLIIYAIPGFDIPSFTGDFAPDLMIFLLGGFFLWFVLWYWVFMVRDRLRRVPQPDEKKEISR
ncbi:MAG TPA: hypothetical protein VMW26_06790 [Methanomassiliicoccales archaeon]|nr:hypothetical protein [Methanomassiliicoccales archaeon]